ncbi:MAG: IPT/TIG domain-containing protein, partial [Williamsia herbipolensis]|nr:IPT/TIG domain-containing protein [Williamsia herbipolensis]
RYGFDKSQDGGAASDASLYQPAGSAVDEDGNVYLADSGDNVVLEVLKSDGTIHLVAGTGTAGGAGAAITPSSTGTSINLNHPESVTVDSQGNLFIADTFDNRVVEVAPDGAATLVAGTGKAGYTGDGTAATAATLSQPAGVAVDSQDDIYIADSSNNVIRRVDAATGVITTVAGDYAADQSSNSCLGAYSGDGGQATSAQLNDPQGVALDGAGDLFIADSFNNAIREVTPDGTISTVVNVGATAESEGTSPTGSGSLPATTHLNTPYAVAVDRSTNTMYIADTKNSAIAEVLNVAQGGRAGGPIEPADQVATTGSGTASAACAALANAPVVTGLSPVSGPRTGGTAVAITGTHFTGTTGVMFGAAAGTDVTVVDDSHLTVTTPAHAAGDVDVTITNAAGTSTSVPADEFTYLPLQPTITKVAPATGPSTGGTRVTVTGTNLTGATGVTFGTTAGTKITVVDDTHLTVKTPAHKAGTVDVTVTTSEGTSTASSADHFTYKPVVPVVTKISPASGPRTGGTTVTITGSHFTGTTKVAFGTVAAKKVVVTDDTHLRVTTPAHKAGRVAVTVTNADGHSAAVAADR